MQSNGQTPRTPNCPAAHKGTPSRKACANRCALKSWPFSEPVAHCRIENRTLRVGCLARKLVRGRMPQRKSRSRETGPRRKHMPEDPVSTYYGNSEMEVTSSQCSWVLLEKNSLKCMPTKSLLSATQCLAIDELPYPSCGVHCIRGKIRRKRPSPKSYVVLCYHICGRIVPYA